MEDIPSAKKITTLQKLIIFCIGAGVLLQFVGFTTPGWLVRQRDSKVSHGGLWYVILCDSSCRLMSAFDEEGKSFFISSYTTTGRFAFTILKWQIGCFFALGSSISALIFIILTKRNKLAERFLMKTTFLIVSMSLCLGSGVLSLALCAELANEHVQDYTYFTSDDRSDDHVSPVVFPYSLFLFGLGGLSLSIAFVFLVSFLVCNVYGHQMKIFNALKYQVQGTQTAVSSNAACPENGQRNILSTEASINSANRNQAAMQSDLLTIRSNAAPTFKLKTGLFSSPIYM